METDKSGNKLLKGMEPPSRYKKTTEKKNSP